MKISFNRPSIFGGELEAIKKAINKSKFSGDGEFNHLCQSILEKKFATSALVTPSGTAALEMTALLIEINPGDEVILPSFGFSSTANAFILRGARVVFVDIRPDTLNINENLIEAAVSKKTKAIVLIHYGGVGCEMEKILKIAKKYNLILVEDAAHAIGAKYKNKYLGTFGTFGCFSFHETKNVQCGEGGALLINSQKYLNQAEIIREKGTDRSRFHRGEIDKYSWRDLGSSYLLGELPAAFLSVQLKSLDRINSSRLKSWRLYYQKLLPLAAASYLELPQIPPECEHNAHLFFIKLKNLEEREEMRKYLNKKGIGVVFHYLPLHKSCAGRKFGRFHGKDAFTSKESNRLLRLPLFDDINEKEIDYVVDKIDSFLI